MLNVLNKHNTLTNFYHPKKHLIFPKNDYNYISKAKQEYNNLINSIQRKRRNNFINNNSKNKLIYHSSNRNLNILDVNAINLRKNIVTTTTSVNFWKGRNNANKFDYDQYLEKNNKKIVRRNNYLYNSFNTNTIKNERDTSNAEQKFKVDSKMFELFINDYEKKIKKTLAEIDGKSTKNKKIIFKNEKENEKNNIKDYNNYETYEKNFYNLLFLCLYILPESRQFLSLYLLLWQR